MTFNALDLFHCDVCKRLQEGVSFYECNVCDNRFIHACPACKQDLVLNPSPSICRYEHEEYLKEKAEWQQAEIVKAISHLLKG